MGPRDDEPENATANPPEPAGPLLRALTFGVGGGALGGCAGLAFEFILNRGQSGLADLSWPTFLVAWPIMGGLVGWHVHRNPEARVHGFRRPEAYFATGPVPEDQREARDRRVRRSVWTGFAVGVIAALATAAVDFASRGWPYVGGTLTSGLILFPSIGAVLGFNQALRRGDPKLSLRDARFGMRTLMILTAYLALLLGLGMRVSRISTVAKSSLMRSQSERLTAEVYRKILDEQLARSDRDDLTTAPNIELYRRLFDHQQALAEKYAKAAADPWRPIAPDPPPPR